jgi:hypothetical protein
LNNPDDIPDATFRREDVIGKLKALENENIFNDLDYSISIDEICWAIRSLKNGKASRMDSISNEMLKNSNNKIILVIRKLFNLILTSSKFPE